MNGLALAGRYWVAGSLIFGDWQLGMVLGLAMIVNQIVAALGACWCP